MTAARESSLREILQQIAAEQNYHDPVFEVSAIPITGANFSSQLFRATIRSDDKEDLNVFAKASVIGEAMRNETGIQDFFQMEPFFYTRIVPRFMEIENEHNVPEEDRLFLPKFYGTSNEYTKEVLVLEDLAKKGFVTYDRLTSIDWEYASKSVELMAKFHALFIAYQNKYPEEYEEAKKVLKRPMMDDNGLFSEMLNRSVKQATLAIREENKERFNKYFESDDKINDVKNFYIPHKRPVIVHSDFRPSNLMHKIDEDGNLKVVVVDFQTMHEGSVIVDLLYFIFCGSDGQFREKYFDRLINHYYENLAAALKIVGVDPEEAFPRADFDEELRQLLPFGLVTSILLLPLITIDVENVTKTEEGVFETESFTNMTDMLSKMNPLCAERIDEVVNDFVKWGVL